MSDSVSLKVLDDHQDGIVRVRIRIDDPSKFGKQAKLQIEEIVTVHDSRAVNDSKIVHTIDFVVRDREETIKIPEHSLDLYTYNGKMVDINLHAKLVIDDGIFWDTTVSKTIVQLIGHKPDVYDLEGHPKQIIEPKDYFNIITNIAVLPFHNKMKVIAIIVVGGIIALGNLLMGYHDQMSPGSEYFYTSSNSDGESQSPLFNSLFLTGGAGVGAWFVIRRYLRKYMTFKLRDDIPYINRETSLSPADLIYGYSHVDLEDAVLRVVACNMEQGQYKRGSGTDERTVSFSEPIRAVILYEKQVPLIPRNREIAGYFTDHFDCQLMFDVMYPPQMVSSTHGLSVHWEVQLLHRQLVDQELVCPPSLLSTTDFYHCENSHEA